MAFCLYQTKKPLVETSEGDRGEDGRGCQQPMASRLGAKLSRASYCKIWKTKQLQKYLSGKVTQQKTSVVTSGHLSLGVGVVNMDRSLFFPKESVIKILVLVFVSQFTNSFAFSRYSDCKGSPLCASFQSLWVVVWSGCRSGLLFLCKGKASRSGEAKAFCFILALEKCRMQAVVVNASTPGSSFPTYDQNAVTKVTQLVVNNDFII